MSSQKNYPLLKKVMFERAPCQLCISVGAASFSLLELQLRRAERLADLVEIRLDFLSTVDRDACMALKAKAKVPLLWTYRKKEEGGRGTLCEEERIALLHFLLGEAKVDWIDVEASLPRSILERLQKESSSTRWILSAHMGKKSREELAQLFDSMRDFPAHYYKIACQGESVIDAIEMINFAREVNRESSLLCAISTGQEGRMSRILAPFAGAPLTYASLSDELATASGQVSAEELLCTYHFRLLDRYTLIFGLIGNPVVQSPSHQTHNAVLRALHWPAVYLKFCLKDDELFPFFAKTANWPIGGLSVTMPFKEKVAALLQEQTEAPYNTLVKEAGRWRGTNTDGVGAMQALIAAKIRIENQTVAILGAGATARAIGAAAHALGAYVIFINRTKKRAEKLARDLGASCALAEELPHLLKGRESVIIQATSVGMAEERELLPIPPLCVPKNAVALDVLLKEDTPFLKEIRKKGGKAILGRELFVYQAVEQFAFWAHFLPVPKGERSSISRSVVEETIRSYLPRANSPFQDNFSAASFRLPPSKSHTIRALLFAAFAEGTSKIYHPLHSPDVTATVEAICSFGAKVEKTAACFSVTGIGGEPKTADDCINVGNSGQLLRFGAALSCLGKGWSVFTGDASIRSNRGVQPLIEGLKAFGATAFSTRENGCAPLIVKGPLKPGKAVIEGEDSQPVSALLMAAAFIEGKSEIEVLNPGERPWILLTLSWLDRLSVAYERRGFEYFAVRGKKKIPSFEVTIPGDLSSLAFPVAAALITKVDTLIENVDLEDVQGDKVLLEVLEKMGATFERNHAHRTLRVRPCSRLVGRVIDVNDFIDAVPILAVIGCFAEGETRLVNAAIARKKESNRLNCMERELRKMGAVIEEREEGLWIRPSKLRGAKVQSHHDHRIALSLLVAGLGAEGETEVEGVECIEKSYPSFLDDLKRFKR